MKNVLIICPFDHIYPPVVGGSKRFFHIIHQLARYYSVTVIINQDKASFSRSKEKYPAMNNVVVHTATEEVSTGFFSFLPKKFARAIRYRWLRKKIFATTDGNFLKYYKPLKNVLSTTEFHYIILESLAALNAVPTIRRFNPRARIFYNAHNIDSHLSALSVEKWDAKAHVHNRVLKAEKKIHTLVDAVLVCSIEDHIAMQNLNSNKLLTCVVPNGMEMSPQMHNGSVFEETPKYIIFCGALWTRPNSEGLAWFCNEIWPIITVQYPSLKLLVVGSGDLPAGYNYLKEIPNTVFTGTVPDVSSYYNQSALAVVPLLSGSGTRLKVLEAMMMGVPVVSTQKGAEGILYTDNVNIKIANESIDFSACVINLLADKNERKQLSEKARILATSTYDWDIIGEGLAKFLNDFNKQ